MTSETDFDRRREYDAERSITRTIALYGQLLDDKRFDEFGELFADDATWSVAGLSLRGRREIVGELRRLEGGEPGWLKHLAFQPVIDLDGDDRARAWTDLVALHRSGADWRIVSVGRYYDTFVRVGERWRFSTRTADVIPLAALASFVPDWSENSGLSGLPPPPAH